MSLTGSQTMASQDKEDVTRYPLVLVNPPEFDSYDEEDLNHAFEDTSGWYVPESPVSPPPPASEFLEVPGAPRKPLRVRVISPSPSPSRDDNDNDNDNQVNRYLNLNLNHDDSYYWQPPPLDIPMTQPVENDDDINDKATEEEEDTSYNQLLLDDPEEQMELDQVYVDLCRTNRSSKRAVEQGIHGLNGAVLTLLKEEQRMRLANLRNMERLKRHCLTLMFKGKIKKARTNATRPRADAMPAAQQEVKIEDEEYEISSESESVQLMEVEDTTEDTVSSLLGTATPPPIPPPPSS